MPNVPMTAMNWLSVRQETKRPMAMIMPPSSRRPRKLPPTTSQSGEALKAMMTAYTSVMPMPMTYKSSAAKNLPSTMDVSDVGAVNSA